MPTSRQVLDWSVNAHAEMLNQVPLIRTMWEELFGSTHMTPSRDDNAAGPHITSGTSNVAIGHNAGRSITSGPSVSWDSFDESGPVGSDVIQQRGLSQDSLNVLSQMMTDRQVEFVQAGIPVEPHIAYEATTRTVRYGRGGRGPEMYSDVEPEDL